MKSIARVLTQKNTKNKNIHIATSRKYLVLRPAVLDEKRTHKSRRVRAQIEEKTHAQIEEKCNKKCRVIASPEPTKIDATCQSNLALQDSWWRTGLCGKDLACSKFIEWSAKTRNLLKRSHLTSAAAREEKTNFSGVVLQIVFFFVSFFLERTRGRVRSKKSKYSSKIT